MVVVHRLAPQHLILAALLALCGCASLKPTTSGDSLESPISPVEFVHMKLELTLTEADVTAQRLPGRVTFRIRPRTGPPIDQLQLNCSKLEIREIARVDSPRAAPQSLRFHVQDPFLLIDLGQRFEAGSEFQLQIDYVARPQPEALYFLRPDDDHPHRPTMIYTMSEPLRARCWIPCFDWPNTRWPSDVYIRVPAPLSAVSVGEPVGAPISNADGSHTFHWRLEYPTDPHLIGIAISDFRTIELGAWRGRPVRAYVQPGLEDAAHYSLRRAPEIIDYYTTLIGVDYPYPEHVYATVVEHFHGGMEHAGFDMIAPALLTTGPRGDVPEDVAQYNYVAHMLGHSWFGGIVNYRDVNQAWLNEAYATYLHLNWFNRTEGPDAFVDEMWLSARRTAARDVAGRDKPVVRDDLPDAAEVYRYDDGKIYFKGAWILHMLRNQLGEAAFWEATRNFLSSHERGSATTSDLIAAFERSGGRDLKSFFAQWVQRDGIPRLAIEYTWNPNASKANVVVRQTQLIDEHHPAFSFPLDVWIRVNGEWQKETLNISTASFEKEFELAGNPDGFCADPLGVLLAAKKESKAGELWRKQIREGPTALARSVAIEHARTSNDAEANEALRNCLNDGSEAPRVRRRAAEALGRIRTDAALAALLSAAGRAADPPMVRAAIAMSLGRFPSSDEAWRAASAWISSDQDILVQAAAIQAQGEFGRRDRDQAMLELIARAALPPTSRYVRNAALAALRRIDDPGALPFLIEPEQPKPDDDLELRGRWIDLVGVLTIGKSGMKPAAIDFLFSQLRDSRPSIRVAACKALGQIGDDDTLLRLKALPADRAEPVRKSLNEALEAIERRANAAPA